MPAREYVSTYSWNVGSNSIPCEPGSGEIRVRLCPSSPIRTRGRRSGPSIAPLQYSTRFFSSTPYTCSTSHPRSEEHTSELQSQSNLVCRLLLEKKKHNDTTS